jgi:hypothetical protein|tara:strand:- start:231 stop:686 length:456 start_codon:yes stop_codon:yes gene_type:complete
MFSFSSFAQEDVSPMKTVRDDPEKMATISELTSCGIVYFNLALHLKIADDVILMFDPSAGSDRIMEAQKKVQENWADLKDQLEAMRFDLYEQGYNLQEIDYLIGVSINQTTQLISKTMGLLAQDENAVRYGLEKMIEFTDGCDKQFLLEVN